MCEPLMHISFTQNEQDVSFETVLSRSIPLESTMHLKIIQVAIRLNSIFPLVTNKTFYCVHIAMSYALESTSKVEFGRPLLRIRGHGFSFRPPKPPTIIYFCDIPR